MNGLSLKNLVILSKTNQTPKHRRDPFSGLETGEKYLKGSVTYRFWVFVFFFLKKHSKPAFKNYTSWSHTTCFCNNLQNPSGGVGFRSFPLLLRMLWFSLWEAQLLHLPLPPNTNLHYRRIWLHRHYCPWLLVLPSRKVLIINRLSLFFLLYKQLVVWVRIVIDT